MAECGDGGAKPSDGNASGSHGIYKINLENFRKRLKALYLHWKEHKTEFWGSSVAAPPLSNTIQYRKSLDFSIWLLGYEFPETIMVFAHKQIHFLCTQKKAMLLGTLKRSAKEAVGADVVIHVKLKKGDDGAVLMDAILETILCSWRKSGRHGGPMVGHIAEEAPEGKLLQTWAEKVNSSSFQLNDISSGFTQLFAVKDEVELMNVKKAANLTSCAMKHFVVPELEKIIEEEKKVSHSSLMDGAKKAILNPAKIKVKLKAGHVDISYPPIFQSGGVFDVRASASSNGENLYYGSAGVIVCAMGSRYNGYCSNIARTFLIDANAMQCKAYKVLLRAQESAIRALKPGSKFCAAYQAAVSIVKRDASEFIPHLTKSAGAGIGLDLHERGSSLNLRNDRVLKAGMVFNVSIGFQDLKAGTGDPKTEKFSMLLADTVIVNDKAAEVATSISSKSFSDIAYSFDEEEEVEKKERPKAKEVVEEGLKAKPEALKATLRSQHREASEEMRRRHQAELARQKNEEAANRLAGAGSTALSYHGSAKGLSGPIAYKNVDDVPNPRDFLIQIDQKNEAILLPVHGSMVPFHIATVKSISASQSSYGTCYIHIIFNPPATLFGTQNKNSQKLQQPIYVKKVSFRSKDPKHIGEVVRLIRDLHRRVKSREFERAERATLVTQEKLQLRAASKFRPIRLPGLWIRPPFGGRGRKMTGVLECHANGFRYSTSRSDECIDFMYQNIKHAFFQPAERELISLLHFHLHHHIMLRDKKTKDVQFYVEVTDVVQTVGSRRRSVNDPDEIEEERRERERKNGINRGFQNFVGQVSNLWRQQPQLRELGLEFEQPLRELGFHGVPHKASAFIVPTPCCLVELIEMPFLVVTLGEVEIVSLERAAALGNKTFDMIIVFKDFKRDVVRIESIPSTSLDGIKEWLDTAGLKYYESKLCLSWRQILKTIADDPKKFVEDGGWEFLNLEGGDTDEELADPDDQQYEPSDMESESESEDEESDSESVVESDEEEGESEESEEEGKTWEELEREARNADREKGEDSDSEEERKRKAPLAKSRVPDKREMRGGPSKKLKLR